MPSLQEYVLIDPDTRRAEAFRINADGLFVLYDMSEAATLELTSIGCQVTMSEVFAGIDIAEGT